MYEDLAQSQRRPALEWLVVNAMIPSLLFSAALQITAMASRPRPIPLPPLTSEYAGYALTPGAPAQALFIDARGTPVLVLVPRVKRPLALRGGVMPGYAILEGAVAADGRINGSSVAVRFVSDPRLEASARHAMLTGFRVTPIGWRPLPARVRVFVEFSGQE